MVHFVLRRASTVLVGVFAAMLVLAFSGGAAGATERRGDSNDSPDYHKCYDGRHSDGHSGDGEAWGDSVYGGDRTRGEEDGHGGRDGGWYRSCYCGEDNHSPYPRTPDQTATGTSDATTTTTDTTDTATTDETSRSGDHGGDSQWGDSHRGDSQWGDNYRHCDRDHYGHHHYWKHHCYKHCFKHHWYKHCFKHHWYKHGKWHEGYGKWKHHGKHCFKYAKHHHKHRHYYKHHNKKNKWCDSKREHRRYYSRS